ncbi:uncharacterized protein SAMN05421676_10427 [Salinibacillus kushneri]|uniref:HD domain-containing protein n=1 Tax=Salinibacillus kushneri TaxID=237682 RepID=A0A1I0DIV2_9BACI|nr:HD domain-containing protein [Salinibacillus kushneri]SET31991.1 uncharacterized protein SAMN05421676_10427 [Salinibacillus kushneri]
MDKQKILTNTEQWISERFSADTTGHDLWHMKRVVRLAKHIAYQEKADPFICQLAAYLHDVSDEKLVNDVDTSIQEIFTFLTNEGVEEKDRHAVWRAIKDVSFKGNHTIPEKMEGKVVQDADRLDALGAIGIARTFAYGGSQKNKLFDPNSPNTLEQMDYRNPAKTTIDHFYEKLLKLKNLMNTESAKEIAEDRHQFMEQFLARFYAEWNGDD